MLNNKPICVQIVSSDPTIARRLLQALRQDSRIQIERARSSKQAGGGGCHIFVMDMTSRKASTELVRRLAARHAGARFVVVSDESHKGVRRLLNLGVHGLVRLGELDRCLVRAVLTAEE